MPLDSTTARLILDHLNGISELDIVPPLKLTIYDQYGGAVNTPQTITLAAAAAGSGPSAGKQVTSNSTAVLFVNMPACRVESWAIHDSSGSPRRIWWGETVRDREVPLGDSYEVPAGALSLELG